MPTPAKAYIDPTYLSKRAPDPAPAQARPMVLGAMLAPIPPLPRLTPAAEQIPYITTRAQRVGATNHAPKVPDPPFGRSVIVTFPAIYKEKKAQVDGQFYPPPAP